MPIPAGPWKSVSLDFIKELPLAGGYDAVLVTIDRFTKMAHFLPMTSNITTEQTAQLYYQHVWKLHGVPEDIVSDRGPHFVSHFMRCLLQKLEIQGIAVNGILTRSNPNIRIFDVESWIRQTIRLHRFVESNLQFAFEYSNIRQTGKAEKVWSLTQRDTSQSNVFLPNP